MRHQIKRRLFLHCHTLRIRRAGGSPWRFAAAPFKGSPATSTSDSWSKVSSRLALEASMLELALLKLDGGVCKDSRMFITALPAKKAPSCSANVIPRFAQGLVLNRPMSWQIRPSSHPTPSPVAGLRAHAESRHRPPPGAGSHALRSPGLVGEQAFQITCPIIVAANKRLFALGRGNDCIKIHGLPRAGAIAIQLFHASKKRCAAMARLVKHRIPPKQAT